MFSKWFILILIIQSSAKNKNFCQNGRLDSAVRTQNGRIFVFFGTYLLEFKDDLTIKTRDPIQISQRFQGIGFDRIDASFTADGQYNPKRGYTYLIRNDTIKEFNETKSTYSSARISEWSTYPLNENNLVINQIGDPIAIFTDLSNMENQDIQMKYTKVFYFDSLIHPTLLTTNAYVEMIPLIDNPFKKNNLVLRAVIGLSNNSYLLFYDSNDSNVGKYCVTQELKDGVSLKLISNESLIETLITILFLV